MTYREVKYQIAEKLKKAGIENELVESGFLMEIACGADRNFYLMHQADAMPEEQLQAYQELAAKRCAHIPLQHLSGEQEFMGLPFRVTPDVLIPRQDTEILVEQALHILDNLVRAVGKPECLDDAFSREKSVAAADNSANLQTREQQRRKEDSSEPKERKETRKIRVLDLCTGSGCIAVSLKAFHPEVSVVASDISDAALAVARDNAARNHIKVPARRSGCLSTLDSDDSERDHIGTSDGRYRLAGEENGPCIDAEKNEPRSDAEMEFIQSDLFEKLSGRFDLIVSNPPYIPSSVIPTLMPEVREHEPVLALDGRADGLHFYRRIIAESPAYLKKGGRLLFEIGAEQGEAVSNLMRERGFCDVRVIRDLADQDRVVMGRIGV